MHSMTIERALSRPTVSVPDAGAVFYGLSRNGSYEAARRGDLRTIRNARKIVCPVAPIAAKLGLATTFGRAA
jgi:hypothetical protein